MPVLHQLQPSFNNGEISPLLYDRVDYNKFTSSVKSGKNMFVHPQGGMSNRAGTKMLGEAKKDRTVIVDEEVNLYAWHIEGYDNYYTEKEIPSVGDPVYKNDEKIPTCEVGLVDTISVPNTIRVIDNGVVRGTIRDNSLDTIRIVTKTKVLNNGTRLIPFEFSNTETYMIEFGNEYCRFYTTNGQVIDEYGAPYEIPSPFKTEDLDKIRYCQSADVMYIAWGGEPQTLIRYGHTDWKFADYDYKNGPFELENNDQSKQIGIVFDKSENLYKITASEDLFKEDFNGRLFYIRNTFKGGHWSGSISSSTPLYVSETILVSGGYEFHTKGTWTGTIKIEYSKDKVLWKSEREFSSYDNFNSDFSGDLEEGLWWVRVSATITNGTCTYTLDTQSVQRRLVFAIKSFVDSKTVWAISKEDIVDLGTVFTGSDTELNVGEILNVIPTMTSATEPAGEAYGTEMPASSNPYLLGDGLPYPAWQAFGADAQQRYPFSRPAYAIKKEESGVLGYEPAEACYVNKITFYGAVHGTYKGANISLDSLFSSLKIKYRLNQSIATEVNYSSSVELLERQKFENDTTTTSDDVYIHNVKITLTFQTVLTDDFFLEFVASSPSETGGFVDRTYWSGGGLIYGMKAFGFKYVAGQEIANNFFTNWAFGLWDKKNIAPTEVDLYQDRIVWSTNNKIDATKISDYTNFGVSEEVTDDDAVSVIIKDKKINKINSAIAGSQLVVFTDSGNFIHNNDTFTPSSATFLNQGSTGGANVKPVIVRDNIIYVHPMKQAISDYAYSFETDGYAGQDITLLANHLFDNKKIKEITYQQEPYSIIWVLQEEGSVLACTYLRQQNVIAWTPMDFGGKVVSIGVMSNGSNQELYLAVERKNGVFIEKMPYRMLDNDPKERFFVDCGSTYRGEPANIIAGLEYLEGESVVVLADGYVVKDLVVENGQITLPTPASIVTVGLPYESVLETLTFDVSQGDGSNLNRKKRVVAVSVRYNNSRGSRISVNGHREVPMLERKIENTDTDISLKSGFYREILPSAHNEPTTIKIRQDEPLPLTIVSIIPELEYER